MEDFSRISNSLGCGLLVFNETMKIERANAEAGKIFRLSPENLVGKPLASIERMFVGTPGRKSPLKHCVEKHERLVNQELELRLPGGGSVLISLNASPLLDARDKVDGLVIDFIERPRREVRLHQFIGAMDEVVFEFDSEGRYLNVWSGDEALLKVPPQELLGKRYEDVMPQELAANLKSALQRVQRTGQPETIEYPLEVLGGRRWFLGRVAKVAAPEEGEPTFSFLARDITERKELEERLQESERKFHGIFDESLQFFGLLRPDGMLMEINKTACDFLGVEESAEIGKPFWETPWWAHSSGRQRELRQAIKEAARGACVRFETTYVGSNGKEYVVDFSLKPVLGENGKVEMLIPEGWDVTERKRAEEKLQELNRELQEANRELDAFVQTISHDLRTPLTAISGYAQLVKELYCEVLDERGLDMLAEIEKSSGRMENLLADLLLLAKVGKIQSPAEPVDTNLVVQHVLVNLAESISGTGIEVNIVQQLPAVQLPATLLTQVFDNLIGNAVRYAGGIGSPIEIGGERKGKRVRFYVRDHGPGIPPEERKRIFDLFYRGSTAQKIQGTGIGLATVQKIARLYRGMVWMEETPGGGATFWVELAEDKE